MDSQSRQGLDGFLLVDKPKGISSFAVVSRVRYLLSHQVGQKLKVGHTGTLDPFASGLMIVVVGSYCKQAARYAKLDKTYRASALLGFSSTTGDPEGTLQQVSSLQPDKQSVAAVLEQFQGPIEQIPPLFSAIKINGQRAYKLARAGQDVVLPARPVLVHRLEAIQYVYPRLELECDVSSGTYIRSLVQDIGLALGTGAYTAALRRLTVGPYRVSEALSFETLSAEALRAALSVSLVQETKLAP